MQRQPVSIMQYIYVSGCRGLEVQGHEFVQITLHSPQRVLLWSHTPIYGKSDDTDIEFIEQEIDKSFAEICVYQRCVC